MDRRKSPRIRVRLPCAVDRSGRVAKGTLLDVSSGGLCVQTDLEAEQGEPISVRFQAPGAGEIEVQAFAWHLRCGTRRGTGERCRVLGLMLSRAPDAYYRLLPGTDAPASPPSSAPGEGAADPRVFRVRVKARSGPRTRVLSLGADSESEARAAAAAELSDAWEILEVWPA